MCGCAVRQPKFIADHIKYSVNVKEIKLISGQLTNISHYHTLMNIRRSMVTILNVTMTLFAITLHGQCCRCHVVGRQIVSDIRVDSSCWSICSLSPESNNTNLLLSLRLLIYVLRMSILFQIAIVAWPTTWRRVLGDPCMQCTDTQLSDVTVPYLYTCLAIRLLLLVYSERKMQTISNEWTGVMPWLHVKWNYFNIISALSTSVWNNFAWNYFKMISQAYASWWIFSNMFNVAEIILK